MKIFSVFDDKAQAFLQPFFMKTGAEALRAFGQAVSEEGHSFCKHASDYTLFGIGVFDQETGKIAGLDAHTNLGNGLVVKGQMAGVYDFDAKMEAAIKNGEPVGIRGGE